MRVCLSVISTANPLSCAAAAAVLEYIVAQNVVENAQAKGVYLGKRLKEALGDSPIVGDIRVRQHTLTNARSLYCCLCL